jgi:hypothetical protein
MARNEWKKTTQLVKAAVEILEREHPMTLRQCFYRLVSIGELGNCLADYRRLSKVLTVSRNDGRIDFDWIVDRSRPNYSVSAWANLRDFGEAVLASYRRDNWQDQPMKRRCRLDFVTTEASRGKLHIRAQSSRSD